MAALVLTSLHTRVVSLVLFTLMEEVEVDTAAKGNIELLNMLIAKTQLYSEVNCYIMKHMLYINRAHFQIIISEGLTAR